VFRKYDLVVFGASGFTGKLICSYIDSHKDSEAVKWAIAGRNYKKLKSVRDKLDNNNKSIDILVVDSFNKESIDNMCKDSAVVISIVGPYSIYGEYLIESCVKFGTHYLDLTGEPEFVKKVEEKFSKNSISSGSIILNCCGFESIPADIGTYLAFKTLNAKNFKVENYLLTRGKISGGTWASFLNSIYSTSSPSRGYTQ